MIKITNIETWGWRHAIRGMRNPLNSWDISDSSFYRDLECDKKLVPSCEVCKEFSEKRCETFSIGDKDLDLMKRLFKAGTEHRKYLRQIFVSMDIEAPLYWYKEMETYKVGTVSNSTSTMHTLFKKDLSLMDFSKDKLNDVGLEELQNIIDTLNLNIEAYNETHDKEYWYQVIQLLPSSFNQKRTITMNYENVFTILKQREGHKLDEWKAFCETLKELPYVKEISGGDEQ